MASTDSFDEYTDRLCERIALSGKKYKRKADTIYFGGGTPSFLGAERLCRILRTVKDSFRGDTREITLEVNPEKKDLDFEKLRAEGFNRISIGLQSANDNELEKLGRLHNVRDAEECIRKAKEAGFNNISLDLMIATPGQTEDSLMHSIEFCAEHGATHISAYILKLEQGTRYYEQRHELMLADDDKQADMYLSAVSRLFKYGYKQYEISNFAKDGYEGRHNLKYWHDEEYLGFGPSAHSFIDGRRFYYGRSFEDFYNNNLIDDGTGGDAEEYIMLGARLREGINNIDFQKRFGTDIPLRYIHNAMKLNNTGLLYADTKGFRLTEKGFLLSNIVIAKILEK